MLKKLFRNVMHGSKNLPPDFSGLLERRYREKVAQQYLQHDDAQLKALQKLQNLLEKLPEYVRHEQKSKLRKRLTKPPEQCRSLYIFGDVGRGKSMLMDLFYESCPFSQKRRVHFLAFMQEVHGFIHTWRQHNKGDALPALARKIRQSTLLLCFDEFHVTDIADAMILVGLFSRLFESGMIVVITSNRHPYDLYRGGLLKDQFLPFVRLLEQTSDLIRVAANEDYRIGKAKGQLTRYYFPLGHAADQFIKENYNKVTHSTPMQSRIFQVLGRQFALSAVQGKTAVASFDQLCAESFGPADYLAIANAFSTLIITDIPQLTREKRNEAKRFVTLIDALYEHKVRLICSAEVPVQELYIEGDGSFEFGRTVSRIIEMQSESYRQI